MLYRDHFSSSTTDSIEEACELACVAWKMCSLDGVAWKMCSLDGVA